MDQALLTVDELAGKLKVPKSWVYYKAKEKGPNKLPLIRVGKYLRFEYDQVMNWLINQQEEFKRKINRRK
ncbi:MAG: helix-turn-helix domain-containing protein [Desulfobacterales bacterium]|jgi:excisionase family DNA binding protein